MKRIKSFFKRRNLGRPVNVVINILLLTVIMFAIYVLRGSPALSDEMALRRAERSALIGPGEILAEMDTESDYYPGVILVRERNGAALFTTKSGRGASSTEWRLIYVPSEDGITIIPEPLTRIALPSLKPDGLYVFAFDNIPAAARAEMDITVSADYNGVFYTREYHTEAETRGKGFFAFNIKCAQDGTDAENEAERYAFSELANVNGDGYGYFPVRVRYYDGNNDLIRDVDTVIMSRWTKDVRERYPDFKGKWPYYEVQ